MLTTATRTWILPPVLACASAANYAVWLAWDQHRDLHADGSTTGPYQSWQIVGLIAGLLALSVSAGLAGRPYSSSVLISVVTAACFALDAATDQSGDGLWVVGAILVLLATFAGGLIAALVGRGMRRA